jgi:hypothetical protein
MLTTYLHLMPRSIERGYIRVHQLPIRLHGIVLNQLNTGLTSLFIFTYKAPHPRRQLHEPQTQRRYPYATIIALIGPEITEVSCDLPAAEVTNFWIAQYYRWRPTYRYIAIAT